MLESEGAREQRSGRTVRFGGFELDEKAGELRLRGRAVRLQDKPLQLLIYLLRKPTSELVTREEIEEYIWGTSRFLAFEDSLNQAVRKLREGSRTVQPARASLKRSHVADIGS